MKLIIQIPCYNEENTLPLTLADLPRHVDGFDEVEWLIIDDGSIDNTIETAKRCGVDYIVRHPKNLGLAAAFVTGLNACITLGADVIVNTDADNQYCAADIPALTKPILEEKAEIVIGERPISQIEHFSPTKKALQKLGSYVVRLASNTNIPDAPSGYRAFSRSAAARLNVYNTYTYTLETIIQAGQSGIPIISVPVRVNGNLRPSRLFKSIPAYIKMSIATIFKIFTVYRPFSFFISIATVFFLIGFLLGVRFLYFWINGVGGGHIQSLILASIMIMLGGGATLLAIVGSLLSSNRRMLEDIRAKINLDCKQPVPHLWRRNVDEAADCAKSVK